MKKTIMIAGLMLVCLFLLAGCKSRGERMVEAVGEIVKAEAAAQGVDLEETIRQATAESVKRTQELKQELEEIQKVHEELCAAYDPLLEEEFRALIESEDVQEIRAHGDKYNQLIGKRDAYAQEKGFSFGRNDYLRLDLSYRSKALFLSAKEYSGYDEYKVYACADPDHPSDDDRLMLMYAKNNRNGNFSELVFIKEDGSRSVFDLSRIYPDDVVVMIESVSEDAIEICAVENAVWNWYVYDLSKPEAELLLSKKDMSEEQYQEKRDQIFTSGVSMEESYRYTPFAGDTLEEFNKMIISNADGAAGKLYQ